VVTRALGRDGKWNRGLCFACFGFRWQCTLLNQHSAKVNINEGRELNYSRAELYDFVRL
jgi:hypothetical protein